MSKDQVTVDPSTVEAAVRGVVMDFVNAHQVKMIVDEFLRKHRIEVREVVGGWTVLKNYAQHPIQRNVVDAYRQAFELISE